MSPASGHPDRRKPYHHGALRQALLDAGIALAREGGPDRVILREAARAAGVSHSAAYRHFADREALLAEVSRHARGELAAEMRRRLNRVTHPPERLAAVGTAYIDFALTNPGLFRTAFAQHPATGGNDGAPARGEAEPFDILGQVLDQAQSAGLLDQDRRPGAEIAVWSAVHGLASLLLDGPLPATGADLDFALRQVFGLIERGLLRRPAEEP
ncbi:TetR/AcrR family transcriptional regulator [Amycolatopsis alkalitolerans]|uniref:TetR/AcrR family transcriptional regulator n=1 Tax=Amycolatopsis alkalitolerans TaxID=2547244 RepID=A0A5C4LYQ8_9PSEU|nr:TetR/AcrR family transcriptional regulator [Amycolatopsis alkalitolerans]TNC24125.1 TetR/AcrR family transcriptional regulator [Amycolatopsis alkalitolerans]